MAENETSQERTEQATPKRREEAREKGQVAKSREIPSVAVLIVCLAFFYFNSSGMLDQFRRLLKISFQQAAYVQVEIGNIQSIILWYSYQAFFILLPLFVTVIAVALLSNIIQVGFLIAPESVMPKFSKIDPLKGFGRLFSLKSFIELLKTIFKMLLVGLVAYVVVRNDLSHLTLLMDMAVMQIIHFIGMQSFKILTASCALLIILAIFDYLYQRYEHEKSIKMTREELKREMKNTEGDPLIKARIRRIQREMAKKRMMAAVPKADVIITNPIHLAVAISYDHKKMKSPVVVAKGAGLIAEKIKEIAKKNDIPLVENKTVAQVLFKSVKIGSAIPEDMYRAVAEILAYVYKLKDKLTWETQSEIR